MNYQLKNFCQNIKYLRELHGYSYTHTAKALHTTVKTLKSIENGIMPERVGMKIFSYASDFFNVSVTSLLAPPQNHETLHL